MIPDAARFEPWLRQLEGCQRARVTSIVPADGGASNITCRVEVEGGCFRAVGLRMQRERGIFEPYDVIREGRVITALRPSTVPVPEMLGSEPDASVLGAPFIVMEWIEAPHMGLARDASYSAFTQAVANIHAQDWGALGLDFLGVPASSEQAILGEIDAAAARMPMFGCAGEPLLARALSTLRGRVPAGKSLRLCQGDINVFNYLFRDGRVAGVVDWEQARIGDCRSDVGQLVALSHLKGLPLGPAQSAPFVQAYQAAAGRELAAMEYFRAFWLFQLAVIYRGWVAFNESEPWYSWAQVTGLLEASLAEIA